jgi:hypothetical protein
VSKRKPEVSGNGIPVVMSASVFVCENPACRKLHLVAYGSNNEPLAQFNNDDENWASLLKVITDALASRFVQ